MHLSHLPLQAGGFRFPFPLVHTLRLNIAHIESRLNLG
jgi:hypothetical protein